VIFFMNSPRFFVSAFVFCKPLKMFLFCKYAWIKEYPALQLLVVSFHKRFSSLFLQLLVSQIPQFNMRVVVVSLAELTIFLWICCCYPASLVLTVGFDSTLRTYFLSSDDALCHESRSSNGQGTTWVQHRSMQSFWLLFGMMLVSIRYVHLHHDLQLVVK
jgi:hypothetical protein